MRHAAARYALGAGGVWQKKFTLNARVVFALIFASSLAIASVLNIAHGNDPSPPALETAIASAPACTPAIGAWTTGSSMPSNFCKLIVASIVLMPPAAPARQAAKLPPAARRRQAPHIHGAAARRYNGCSISERRPMSVHPLSSAREIDPLKEAKIHLAAAHRLAVFHDLEQGIDNHFTV